MTKAEIKEALESLKGSVDSIIRSSPGILPQEPTTEEITAYSAALTSLSFARTDIDRAIVHIDEMKKGGS